MKKSVQRCGGSETEAEQGPKTSGKLPSTSRPGLQLTSYHVVTHCDWFCHCPLLYDAFFCVKKEEQPKAAVLSPDIWCYFCVLALSQLLG